MSMMVVECLVLHWPDELKKRIKKRSEKVFTKNENVI